MGRKESAYACRVLPGGVSVTGAAGARTSVPVRDPAAKGAGAGAVPPFDGASRAAGASRAPQARQNALSSGTDLPQLAQSIRTSEPRLHRAEGAVECGDDLVGLAP